MKDPAALLKAAQKLDEEALNIIFDQFAPAIYKYSLRLTNDPVVADNIVGDVFAQLLEEFGAGKGPRVNLRSYLYQTAYGLFIKHSQDNHYRAQARSNNPFEREILIPAEAVTEEQVMVESLIRALNAQLTEDQRHVIILRFLEDFSLQETAEIIGKEVNRIQDILMGVRKLAIRYPNLLTESLATQLRLPGDQTVDAPPPKKKKKGKGR
jgi:RNA polymerase sigma-70 factor (ECF subfamily)